MRFNEILEDYYTRRGLKAPDYQDAMDFVQTELGECAEIRLYGKGYIRNNPENKEKYASANLGDELGDVIMMIQRAGMAEGFNPLQCLLTKLGKKADVFYTLEEEAQFD
jgi:hypothetical protein